MSPFEYALTQEDLHLVNVQGMKASNCPPRATCIGPTKSDLRASDSAQDPHAFERKCQAREAKLFKYWRNQDLSRFYAKQV